MPRRLTAYSWRGVRWRLIQTKLLPEVELGVESPRDRGRAAPATSLRAASRGVEDLLRIGVERRAVERGRQQHAVAVDDVGARRRRRRDRRGCATMRGSRIARRHQHDLDEAAAITRQRRRRTATPATQQPRAAGVEHSRAGPSATTGAQGGGLKCRGRHGLSSRRWRRRSSAALRDLRDQRVERRRPVLRSARRRPRPATAAEACGAAGVERQP